jgi:hypothetical protein
MGKLDVRMVWFEGNQHVTKRNNQCNNAVPRQSRGASNGREVAEGEGIFFAGTIIIK